MNIASFSIKRPVFIGCLVILMLVTGIIGLKRLGVDLFPPIDFPVVTVTTTYGGASPEEIESLITKPLEEQISTISGIKRLSSRNMEGVSIVIAEFTYETDIRYAEEKMREKVSLARNELPSDLEDEPLVRQFDITDSPVLTLAVTADLTPTELYDLVKERVKPLIEQVSGVGEVRLTGGTRREVQIELDRNRLNELEIPAVTVSDRLKNSGANIPVGKYDAGPKSTLFRTIGEFRNIEQIKKSVISFSGDIANSITVQSVANVRDGAEEASTLAYLYYPIGEKAAKPGFFKRMFSSQRIKNEKIERRMKQCMLIDVYKQSGANPVSVAEGVMSRMGRVNDVIRSNPGNPGMTLIFDTAKYIRRNIDDVIETMIIGIILAVVVVYLFLGNVRSTIITGIAIPNSLLGAFVIMYAMGFTLNLMSLMALSLTVGLLVDDAIVVRENIFRKLESGLESDEAAVKGTTEVMLAVIATTLTIIAVFLPIGFLSGIIGRFFKQFGLSVVFAMSISLFDALTVAPLLSAYFAGTGHKAKNIVVTSFDRFQTRLERYYKSILTFSINRPLIVLGVTTLVLILSLGAFKAVKKTFSPEAGEGEFLVNIDLPSGTSLDGTREVAMQIAERIKTIPELDYMTIQVGNANSEDNIGTLGVFMVPMDQRTRTSAQLQQQIRVMLRDFAYANVSVDRYQRGAGGGGSNKPYILNIAGTDLNLLNDYARKVVERLKKIPDLTEITTSYREGKPEFQVHLDDQKMQALGVTHRTAGRELRYQVEGDVVGKLHDRGLEYDVRIKLRPDQRDIQSAFHSIRVPNIHNKMIPLSAVATAKTEIGPSKILRQDRARVIQVMANTAPGGAIGSALDQTRQILERDMPMPPGISYSFIGQADSFKDTVQNIIIAFFLALIFIYLVLSSLYESFITPFTIFMALPPALSGAFISLFITGNMLDIFSMIGMVMLLGLVTKNSILLVDFAIEGVRSGMTRREAIMHAGMVRLRPILMTTFAMIAGTLPMVIAGGEAGKYRVGMGVVIIGGLTVSTLITLIVVPAVFEYIDIFRESVESRFRIKKRGAAALAPEAAPVATEVLSQPAAPAKKARRSR